MTLLTKIFPILSWLPAYQKEWLRYDLAAGVTMAAVVIPKAVESSLENNLNINSAIQKGAAA